MAAASGEGHGAPWEAAFPTPQSLEALSECASVVADAPIASRGAPAMPLAVPQTRKRAHAVLKQAEETAEKDARDGVESSSMRLARQADFLSSWGVASAKRPDTFMVNSRGQTPAEVLAAVLGPLLAGGAAVRAPTALSQTAILQSLCSRLGGSEASIGADSAAAPDGAAGAKRKPAAACVQASAHSAADGWPHRSHAEIVAAFDALPPSRAKAEVGQCLEAVVVPGVAVSASCSVETLYAVQSLVLAHCVRRGGVPARRACRVQLYAAAVALAFKYGEEHDARVPDVVRALCGAQARLLGAPPIAPPSCAAVRATERRLFSSVGWEMASFAAPLRAGCALLDEAVAQGLARSPAWAAPDGRGLLPSAIPVLADCDGLAKAKAAVVREFEDHLLAGLRARAGARRPLAAVVADALGHALAAVLQAPRLAARLSALAAQIVRVFACA